MVKTEYTYSSGFEVTQEMKDAFDEVGYIIVKSLFDKEEIDKVKQALEGSDAIMKHAFGLPDGEDRESKLCLWNQPGNDVTGLVARCQKVAGTCEKLMGGEVYHYHTKLMMKEAKTGGKHLWHQDYGYWYKNGCLFPDMLSVFIPIDKCVKANGCLQILEGSHRCGRIDHVMVAGQTGADMERVKLIEDVCPHRFVELESGDGLFFHCNLLHTSGINDSNMRRWVLIPAFNCRSNNPVYEHHHACYTKLSIVPDSAVKECFNLTDITGKDFMDPTKDKTIRPRK